MPGPPEGRCGHLQALGGLARVALGSSHEITSREEDSARGHSRPVRTVVGTDHRPEHEADRVRDDSDHGSGRACPKCNPNTRSNTNMDATDFPDDLVQTQAAWNAIYQALIAPALPTPSSCAAAYCSCPSGSGGTPTGRPSRRCQRRAPSYATSPAPTEPSEPHDRVNRVKWAARTWPGSRAR